MKKYIGILIVLVSFVACRRDFDENIFGEEPDTRLRKTLDNLQSRLVNEPNGWTGFLTTGTGLRTAFYFTFGNNNRVLMAADFDPSVSAPRESSYRLKALQQPCLIFDTYSYLHVLADPNGDINGGEDGQGLQSDFEFAYDPSADNEDSIVLTGRMYNTRLVLRPGTREDSGVFPASGFTNAFAFDSLSKRYLNYFKRFTLGGNTYELVVNLRKKSLKLAWMEGGAYKEAMSYYLSSPAGNINLITPLRANGGLISSFGNIQWNNATGQISFDINGERVTPVGFTGPLQAELAAPRRWWERSIDQYWKSAKGFRVNGVDDAYGISRQAAFNHVMYAGEWASPGGVPRDVFGYVRNSAQNYFAPAIISPPNFTNDGRVVFTRIIGFPNDPTSYTYYGTNPAQSGVTATILSLIKLENTQGYYLVQIFDTYDMVDAVNATSWISWE